MDFVDRLLLRLSDVSSKVDYRQNAKRSESKYTLDEKVAQADENIDNVDSNWRNYFHPKASRKVLE